MVGAMRVAPGSDLDGMQMFEMSTQIRVIAFNRQDEPLQLRPRRDDRLRGGDTLYLVGPYRELLGTLRRGLPLRPPTTDEDGPRDGQQGGPKGDGTAVDASAGREARAG
jgi:uncharacterized protein with PhoU and TrkA domain